MELFSAERKSTEQAYRSGTQKPEQYRTVTCLRNIIVCGRRCSCIGRGLGSLGGSSGLGGLFGLIGNDSGRGSLAVICSICSHRTILDRKLSGSEIIIVKISALITVILCNQMIYCTCTVDISVQIVQGISAHADHFQGGYVTVEVCLGVSVYISMSNIAVDCCNGVGKNIDTVIAIGVNHVGLAVRGLDGQITEADRQLQRLGIAIAVKILDYDIIAIFDLLMKIEQFTIL